MIGQYVAYLLGGLVGAAVTLLVAFFVGPWQKFCAAVFESKCFYLRSQLVEAANGGHIGMSDPVYKMLWQHLESHIQSKYAFSLRDLVATHIVFWRMQKGLVPLDEAIQQVQKTDLKEELMQIYERSIEIQILHAVARSPVLPLLVALAPVVILMAFWGTWAQKTRRFIVERAKIADNIRTGIGRMPPNSAPPC